MPAPQRVFLDTNVYIVGVSDVESADWQILQWLGFEKRRYKACEVIISVEVIEQILRVGKRLQGKDWASAIVAQIWKNLNLRYVILEEKDRVLSEILRWLPREDLGIYLTAKKGRADFFISSNHELIRAISSQLKEFECLTPEEFVITYVD
jgi:predicted nucleic acid-binding protein